MPPLERVPAKPRRTVLRLSSPSSFPGAGDAVMKNVMFGGWVPHRHFGVVHWSNRRLTDETLEVVDEPG